MDAVEEMIVLDFPDLPDDIAGVLGADADESAKLYADLVAARLIEPTTWH